MEHHVMGVEGKPGKGWACMPGWSCPSSTSHSAQCSLSSCSAGRFCAPWNPVLLGWARQELPLANPEGWFWAFSTAINQPGQVRGQEDFLETIINIGKWKIKKRKRKLGYADRRKSRGKCFHPEFTTKMSCSSCWTLGRCDFGMGEEITLGLLNHRKNLGDND